MTTSSFDRNRCTRISPSAVLDDRLDGKDLEWARDHLRRCEACRERVEDFREMLLRVGRLPSASVGAPAMDQAYAVSIPERVRGQAGTRSFEIGPAEPPPAVAESMPETVVAAEDEPEPIRPETAVPLSSNVVYGEEPAQLYSDEPASPPAAARKPDTAMRIAVGLGAAACVLLAAVLYEGGWLSKSVSKLGATNTAATASVRASVARPSPTIRASASLPSALPTAAPVLFTLGNGVSGGTVFRIRPGTAIAGYTRLVFDIHGGGLPTMVITKPDDLHIAVTFKNTSATGVPVDGIRSYQVAAIEPPVQQGADETITVDRARPVRVTAFTLAATGSYAWRLVVDLHTS